MTAEPTAATPVAPLVSPLRDTLVARAEALGEALRSRAAAAAEARRIPDATIAEMQDAGFFRMVQPARYGGDEVDPGTFFEVQMAVARACPSTAWVLGVVGIHPWQLALFAPEAQDEVWGADRSTLLSSSYMPVGKVTPVDGGYRLSGRWAFSSGVDHCQWALLGAFVPTPAGPPDMRTFLVPRRDFTVLDTWRTSGLAATGSNDVVVDDAFVPEHRTHRLIDGYTGKNPGNAVNDAPLYRLPFGQIFVRSVSTTAIGIAEGCLRDWSSGVKGAIARLDAARIAEDTAPQELAARATTTIRELKLVLHDACETMLGHARAGRPLPIEDRLVWRYQSALAVQRSVALVDDMFHLTAARAIASESPLQRWFQDSQAARAHYANNPGKPALNLGRVVLGLKNQDYFL